MYMEGNNSLHSVLWFCFDFFCFICTLSGSCNLAIECCLIKLLRFPHVLGEAAGEQSHCKSTLASTHILVYQTFSCSLEFRAPCLWLTTQMTTYIFYCEKFEMIFAQDIINRMRREIIGCSLDFCVHFIAV